MILSEVHQTIIEQLIPVLGNREAEIIAKYYLEDIFACKNSNSNLELSQVQEDDFNADIIALKEGVPIQHITGKAFFYGLEFEVNNDVLIPRPETEELVDLIVKDFKANDKLVKVLDIGTGSACIAVSLAKHLHNAEITAIDISHAALKCAARNAEKHNVKIHFKQSDWLLNWEDFQSEDYDCIVSNPPYIALSEKDKMGKSVLKYEPHEALFAEEGGLVFYKSISRYIKETSKKPMLYLELNEYLAEEIKLLFIDLYTRVEIIKDMQGKSRMLKAII